jgi:hypothetical protein
MLTKTYIQGRGSVLVGTNKCFCSWFFDRYIDQNIEQLLNNIKYWLTGDEHLEDSQIVNIRDAVNSNQSFSNYSILLWDFEYEINDVIATNLLTYLEQGGKSFIILYLKILSIIFLSKIIIK